MDARFAIRTKDARAYPSSAIVAMAASTICARRAASTNDR
jgi:hypothetical protein